MVQQWDRVCVCVFACVWPARAFVWYTCVWLSACLCSPCAHAGLCARACARFPVRAYVSVRICVCVWVFVCDPRACVCVCRGAPARARVCTCRVCEYGMCALDGPRKTKTTKWWEWSVRQTSMLIHATTIYSHSHTHPNLQKIHIPNHASRQIPTIAPR